METINRLRIAVQKSGRLADKSIALLMKCGIDFDLRKDRLINKCKEFPIDLMLVRDDDIPEYIADGVCHLGIVGENVIEEKYLSDSRKNSSSVQSLIQLGFGACRLSMAVPEEMNFSSLKDLNGLRIATSYPSCLKRFLNQNNITATVVELSGSVEIAPGLKIADVICDLVSTGGTLKSNGLKEVTTLLESQAAIFRTSKPLSPLLSQDLERLIQRISGVIRASQSKYIMMNAPQKALAQIQKILPGMEMPSVIPLGLNSDRIAIHAVARETLFWETIESLKAIGASSILVLPIEKVVL
jgi:ATP phosphoribosyltransferase